MLAQLHYLVPSVGDTIKFVDYARNWGTNAIIINPNSSNFQGNTSPNPEYNTNGQAVTITYVDATKGWIPTVDDDVTWETPTGTSTIFKLWGAGGGGSDGADGGGGGSGGYTTGTYLIPTSSTVKIIVGQGGTAGTGGKGGGGGGYTGVLTSVSQGNALFIAGGGGGGCRGGSNSNAFGGGGGGTTGRTGGVGGSAGGEGGGGTQSAGGAGGNSQTASNGSAFTRWLCLWK